MTIDRENLLKGTEPWVCRTRFNDDPRNSFPFDIPVDDENHGGCGAIWARTSRRLNGLTRTELQELVRTSVLPIDRGRRLADSPPMTVEEFVQNRFVPGHVMRKGLPGRRHYRSMLKHVINPASVDRLFTSCIGSDKTKVGPIAGWPYIGHMSLRDVQPDSVLKLVNAAFARGYSSSTIVNMRWTVSTIFAYAIEQSCFTGENPARSERPKHLT